MKRRLFLVILLCILSFTVTACNKKITIKFVTNQSSISFNDVTLKVGESFDLNEYSNQMVVEGYKFKGWYLEDSFKTLVKNVNTETSVTLYGKWSKLFTVNFVTNCDEVLKNQVIEEGNLAIEPDDIVYANHEFGGWYTSESYKTKFDFNSEIKENTTIYALWHGAYKVTFSTTGTPVDDLQFVEGTGKSINQVSTKVGYEFAGWYLDSEYTNVINSTQALTDNTTVYAKFTPNKYTINFNKNGGDGTNSKLECTYDTEYNLTKNIFTKAGYIFKSWNTEANGSGTSYTDEQQVKNLLAENGASLTLYAQYEAIEYTINFNANGGEGSVESITFTYGDTTTKLSKNTFTNGINYFQGWATESNSTSVKYPDEALVSSLVLTNDVTNITLYAVWFNGYTITFDSDKGTAVESITQIVNGDITKPNDPTKVGYTFNGWMDNGTLISEFPTKMMEGGKSYKASWTPISYTVNFNSNGATGEMASQEFAYDELKALTANTFTKDGYKFIGWSLESDSIVVYTDLEEVKNLSSTNESTITLYAQFERIIVKVYVKVLNEGSVVYTFNNYYQVPARTNKTLNDEDVYDLIMALDKDSLNDLVANKTFIGYYLDEAASTEYTSSFTFNENSNNEYTVYLYYAAVITFDLTEASMENVTVNTHKMGRNAYNFVPTIVDREGYIYIWEIDNISNVVNNTTVKVHVFKNDPYTLEVSNITSNQLPNDGGYKYTLAIGSKEYISYYVKTGKYQFSLLNNIEILKAATNFTSANIVSNDTSTTFTFGAQTQGYQFIKATKSNVNVFYQFHIDIVASSFSLKNGYYDYSNIDYSNKKYISNENGIYSNSPYTIGTDNIYKIRFNIIDTDGVPVLSANFNKTYTFKLLGTTASDEVKTLKSFSVSEYKFKDYILNTEITYSGTAYYLDENNNDTYDDTEVIYAYVLNRNTNDNDDSYDRIKFTDGAVNKKIEINVSQTNQSSSETLVVKALINNGVNVESNSELKYYYSNYKITESDATGIINLHSKIICALDADQLNECGSPVNFTQSAQFNIYQKGATYDGYSKDGGVYTRAVTNTEIINNNLVINGNYFTIDGSELEPVRLKEDGSGQTGSQPGYISLNNAIFTNDKYKGKYVCDVQIAIFQQLLVYVDDTNDGVPTKAGYKQLNNSVTYNNMNIISNTITPVVDFSDSEKAQDEQVNFACRNSGGYVGIMNRLSKVVTNNIVLDYCTIGITNAYEGSSLEMNDSYIYYSWANGIYAHLPSSIVLRNSEIRYAGGAAIHIENKNAYVTDGSTLSVERYHYNSLTETTDTTPIVVSTTNKVDMDQRTQLINWVTGSEIWMQLYNMQLVIPSLMGGLQSYVYGTTADPNTGNGYSLIKSYSKLSSNDVAYTSSYGGDYQNNSAMFNFAILYLDYGMGEGTKQNYHNVLEMNFRSFDSTYDCEIKRLPKDSKTFQEYSATDANGISAAVLAAAGMSGQTIYAFPVSPYSSYASNDTELVPGVLTKNGLAQALSTYSGYEANKAGLQQAGAISGTGFFNESAYAVGLQTNGILTHDGNPTGYGWLELGAQASGLIATVYTYYYNGYDIVQ